jgi:hypothetical protein
MGSNGTQGLPGVTATSSGLPGISASLRVGTCLGNTAAAAWNQAPIPSHSARGTTVPEALHGEAWWSVQGCGRGLPSESQPHEHARHGGKWISHPQGESWQMELGAEWVELWWKVRWRLNFSPHISCSVTLGKSRPLSKSGFPFCDAEMRAPWQGRCETVRSHCLRTSVEGPHRIRRRCCCTHTYTYRHVQGTAHAEETHVVHVGKLDLQRCEQGARRRLHSHRDDLGVQNSRVPGESQRSCSHGHWLEPALQSFPRPGPSGFLSPRPPMALHPGQHHAQPALPPHPPCPHLPQASRESPAHLPAHIIHLCKARKLPRFR